MEHGELTDAAELLRLREQAVAWLQSREIRQWSAGEVTVAQLRSQLQRGEWFVMRCAGGLSAAVRFLLSDTPVWGARPSDAAYLHGLMVDRSHTGIGGEVLEWACARAQSLGLRYLRLDCVQGNPGLVAYYVRTGFVEVGRREFDGPWLPAVLLERELRPG